jgi:ankyrin repeat protein
MMQAEQPQNDITILFDAIRKGDAAAVAAMLAAKPHLGEARNPQGASGVLWSAYARHPELAPVLLGTREPDFFEACALGRRERALSLLAADPKLVDAYAADGFTGLGLAIFFGHVEIARKLVDAGADVNRPSRNDIRVFPLHSAIESGKLELVDLLLKHGAKPDPPEFLGATPLHSAAARGNREMVARLLAAGADRKLRTNDGKTAADLARQYGRPELAGELEWP